MTTILVTGATGNVGAHVVRELQARAANVRALVRDPQKAAFSNIDLVVGDFDDPASLRRALAGVDRVYVCAADGPRKVAHETAIIDAAAEAGVERIVKLSAMHADAGSPLPAYQWHGEIEAHLQRTGVPSVVLRPAFFMTNMLMVAGGVAETGKLYAPTANRPVAMIDIRDVAAAAAVTLTADGHEKQVYELTGPEAVTFADFAQAIGDVTGRPVEYVDLSEEAARPRFAGAGLPDWLAMHLAGVFGVIRAGGFAQTTEHVRAITGHPARSIAAFARDFAAAFTPARPGS